MTSKWIRELRELFESDKDLIFDRDILPILSRIDRLLRQAKAGTDDERLLDHIWVEIVGDERVNASRKLAGISSVIPVTNEEAERIFKEIEGQDTIKFSTEELDKYLKEDREGQEEE